MNVTIPQQATQRRVSALKQRRLPSPGKCDAVVLSTTADARSLLAGYAEDDIKHLCQERLIAFAWNIGLGYNIEPRIFPEALRHYALTLGGRPYIRSEDQVLAELLRSKERYLTSRQLRILLNCGASHVTNLIQERQIEQVPGTSYKPGRNGAALIPVPSLREFFTSRRLPQ